MKLPYARVAEDLLDTIQMSRIVEHWRLLKYANGKFGIKAVDLHAMVAAWIEEGLIEKIRKRRRGGGCIYAWKQKKQKLKRYCERCDSLILSN